MKDPVGRYPEGQKGSRKLVDQGQLLEAQGWTVAFQRVKQAWQNGIMDEQSLCIKSSQRQKQREATLKDMETLPAHNRDGVRKAKAQLEFKLEKDLEYNRKAFLHRYTGNKREAKESVDTLISEIRVKAKTMYLMPSVFRNKDLSPNLSGSLRVRLYLRRCGQRDHLTTWTFTSMWDQVQCTHG